RRGATPDCRIKPGRRLCILQLPRNLGAVVARRVSSLVGGLVSYDVPRATAIYTSHVGLKPGRGLCTLRPIAACAQCRVTAVSSLVGGFVSHDAAAGRAGGEQLAGIKPGRRLRILRLVPSSRGRMASRPAGGFVARD